MQSLSSETALALGYVFGCLATSLSFYLVFFTPAVDWIANQFLRLFRGR